MASPNSDQAPASMLSRVIALANRFTSSISSLEEEPSGTQRPTKPPWDSWEIDENFLKALSRWTLENPETTLDRVFDNIRDGLENSKDLLNLIPDSPFPARGLVTALAYLLKLGISIRRAQKDVYDFAKNVVRWVGLVKSAFESAEDGQFTRRAWRDLRHMRELIEKSSLWAVERLNDGRWLRIGHGLMISKEINEFNERIASARALFQDLSAINMARGLDALLIKLRNMIQKQETIIREIQDIRSTQQKQLDRIVNELQMREQVDEREHFFAKTLDLHAITSTAYDSQGKRPCDEDTRVNVLEEIREWRNNIKRGAQNFLWLTGDPGCGKSAVTASFARECKDEGVLWAQFFINRNNAETTDPRSYFPSIARQLADYSPEVAQNIHLTLVKQRSLTDDISAEQAARLFTDSIRKASSLDPNRPVVVVIDGLDETSRDRLEDTATIFSTLFATLESYSNVKVFISSRTESEIQKSFTLPLNTKHVKRLHLDTADSFCTRDVSRYIKRNLLDLVRKHDLNWDVWPGPKRAQTLGDRASGLFIWAVTAIKFIQGELRSHGRECLNEILDMLTADVLHDINALYMLILTVSFQGRQDEWEFERFRRVVGAIVCLQEPLSIDDLAHLLDLRKSPSSEPVDIAHLVGQFRTILVTGVDDIDGFTIPRIHKSVYEFLTSNSIDTRFRVEPSHIHLELATRCLAYLETLPSAFKEDMIPMPFRYACRFWSSHLSQAGASELWVEYSQSPMPSPLSSHSTIQVFFDRMYVHVHYSATNSRINVPMASVDHIWDATNGLSITHTDEVLGVLLSPNGNDIVSWSKDGTIRVWDSTNVELKRRLVEYPIKISHIAIALDGKSVVSTAGDGMVCLWDYFSGASIWKYSPQGDDKPLQLAFSHDGKWIVSSWKGQELRLLDVQNGEMVGKPWTGHRARITGVAFSPSSRKVCSVDEQWCCFTWDVATGQEIDWWKFDIRFYPDLLKCAFSSIDDDVTAVYGYRDIQIRSKKRNRSIPADSPRALSFSPDGKEVIFGGAVGVYVVNITEAEQKPHAIWEVNNVRNLRIGALSPTMDRAYFIDTYEKRAIYVHALEPNHVLPTHQHLYPDTRDQLMLALSNMKKVECDSNTTNNQYLNAMKWHKCSDGVDTGFKACMVIGQTIVCGHVDGSVTVWKR